MWGGSLSLRIAISNPDQQRHLTASRRWPPSRSKIIVVDKETWRGTVPGKSFSENNGFPPYLWTCLELEVDPDWLFTCLTKIVETRNSGIFNAIFPVSVEMPKKAWIPHLEFTRGHPSRGSWPHGRVAKMMRVSGIVVNLLIRLLPRACFSAPEKGQKHSKFKVILKLPIYKKIAYYTSIPDPLFTCKILKTNHLTNQSPYIPLYH